MKKKTHDERKRNYALHHNIELLEIWYYDNVENVLINLLHKEINKVG